METPDPWLENRKRFVAPPPQISCPAGNAADGGLCRHLSAGSWDMVCRIADGVRHLTLSGIDEYMKHRLQAKLTEAIVGQK